MAADGQLAGSPSFLFDAIVSILAPENAQKLTKEAAAIQWFMDAYAHCKTIGYRVANLQSGFGASDINSSAFIRRTILK